MCFEMTKVQLFKALKKNVQIEYKKNAFSVNQFGLNILVKIFIFFMVCYFLEKFGWNLREGP